MLDLAPFLRIDGWISLLTLTALEVVLGIDNLVFLSIMTGKLPPDRQPLARRLGLGLALVMRVLLLLAMSWLVTLQTDLFTLFGEGFSGRDLILIGGGLFLVGKATHEIFDRTEVDHSEPRRPMRVSFAAVVVADRPAGPGLLPRLGHHRGGDGASDLSVMVAAVVIAVLVMMIFAGPISDSSSGTRRLKILALSFLILIGVVLVADGMGQAHSEGLHLLRDGVLARAWSCSTSSCARGSRR